MMATYILVVLHLKPIYLENDNSGIQKFARNWNAMIAAGVVAAVCYVAITLGVNQLRNYTVANYVLGYTFALAMTYVAGYFTYTFNPNTVLVALLGTLIISALMTFCGHLINMGLK